MIYYVFLLLPIFVFGELTRIWTDRLCVRKLVILAFFECGYLIAFLTNFSIRWLSDFSVSTLIIRLVVEIVPCLVVGMFLKAAITTIRSNRER